MTLQSIPIRRGEHLLEPLAQTAFRNYGGIIAGGFARYMVSPYPDPLPRDVDLYFAGRNLAHQFAHHLESNGWRRGYHTVSCMSYHHPEMRLPIQVVYPNTLSGHPERIISNFDFTIVQAFFDFNRAYAVTEMMEDEERRQLVVRNINSPMKTLMRAFKYVQRGYSIDEPNLRTIINSQAMWWLESPPPNMGFRLSDAETTEVGHEY